MTVQLNPKWLALGPATIEANVKKYSKGVYALSTSSRVPILYVGRSDDDLRKRLNDHRTVKSPTEKVNYIYFKFKTTSTTREAYEAECMLFHKHNPPDNKIHPASPKGTNYPCPVKCGK